VGYVLRPEQTADRGQLGGKAAALAALRRARLPIPAWLAISPAAFAASLGAEGQAALASVCLDGDSARVDAALAGLAPSAALCRELAPALAELATPGGRLAVRSSAVDEDGAEHSFAGQLDSLLFVAPACVPSAVAQVWRSAFSARMLAYRHEHGLPLVLSPPAVLIQRMVDAAMSGVAFSADPVSGRRGVAVVSAVYGLGTALVSGDADADTWLVGRDGDIQSRAIATKRSAHRYQAADASDAGGAADGLVTAVPVADELIALPALADEQIGAVAALARACERHFGRPQDIEWAIAEGKLYLLQSRPITSLAGVADPDGAYTLWDNSNIAESYAGVTTPLTFSFARHVYEQVYRQLCRLLGVSEQVIAAHDETYRRMLGLIRGRVYYNLLSWYRLLALAPGFASNRRFMEQMMGVKEGLPDEIVGELGKATWRDRLRDRRRLVGAVAHLVASYRTLPRDIKRFYARLDAALTDAGLDLGTMRADELAAYYRALERQLLMRWDAPLVNDLFAMIFFGSLRRLVVAWCKDASGALQNDLLRGGGGIISAEPAARVRAMAALASAHPALVDALCDAPMEEALDAVAQAPALAAAYAAYLDTFADRCLEELKLESPTLRDDPLPLLRSVGYLARRQRDLPTGDAPGRSGEDDARHAAERRAYAALGRRPLRRALFDWVLRNARERVRDRENLRFERTRVFGRVRRIFVELGRRFAAEGLLAEPRDIFYLEVEEALGMVAGTATTTDLKGLVAVRKAEYARYRAQEPPADRFETRGIVYAGNSFQARQRSAPPAGDTLHGIGCCPGVVRGRVRVVRDPKTAEVRHGEILVAERTDPGWIMLFPAAAGVLVECGSLLSHSAIVARELGIPAIVALAGATTWLQTGDTVEMDGGTGTVVKLGAPAGEATDA